MTYAPLIPYKYDQYLLQFYIQFSLFYFLLRITLESYNIEQRLKKCKSLQKQKEQTVLIFKNSVVT